MSDSMPAPIREEAVRAFVREINHATHTVRASDEAGPTASVLLPTGVTVRRVFVVGALAYTTEITEETTYRQGQIVNPTGILYIHAEEPQSEPARMLREIELPTYIAVVGAPRPTCRDNETEYVPLHPEHLMRVDEARRNWWVRETARRTLERIEIFDDAATEEAVLARNQYGTDIKPYRQAVVTARDAIGETATEVPRKATEKTRTRKTPSSRAEETVPDATPDDPDSDEPESTD